MPGNFGVLSLQHSLSMSEEILEKFVRVVSEIFKKALKVQILNEVALVQVVRKRVTFQDRKNESTLLTNSNKEPGEKKNYR